MKTAYNLMGALFFSCLRIEFGKGGNAMFGPHDLFRHLVTMCTDRSCAEGAYQDSRDDPERACGKGSTIRCRPMTEIPEGASYGSPTMYDRSRFCLPKRLRYGTCLPDGSCGRSQPGHPKRPAVLQRCLSDPARRECLPARICHYRTLRICSLRSRQPGNGGMRSNGCLGGAKY